MSLDRFVEALGWTLVHSLWQLALVGLAAALLLRAAGPARLRLQHALAWTALLLCLALPLATFVRQLALPIASAGSPALATFHEAPFALATPVAVAAIPWPHRLEGLLTRALPWIASAWALGMAVMALRLGGGWLTARDWRRASQPAPAAWEARLQALAAPMGLRARVALRVTARLATPVALGLWRPVVLVPASLLSDLPESYVEALLAHELAHILRRDYLFNLLQNVIEALLFHHPTVWWLSRRIRSLREHLADDLAATAIGEPRRLALALDALDDLLAVPSPHPHLALAARGGTLFDRIQRLVLPPTPRPRPAWLPAALLTLALPCAALSLKAATEPPIPADPALVAELDALAAQEHLDPQLLRSMAWVESSLRRNAKSPNGALGVLQVMPETAKKFGATDLTDKAQVLAAGAKYLRFLMDRYQGDVPKAVAAYNGGHVAIDAGQLSEETQAYVPMVMSVYQAKAVQAETPLNEGEVDGVLRKLANGRWMLMARIGMKEGLVLDILEDKEGGKPFGRVTLGSMHSPNPWNVTQTTANGKQGQSGPFRKVDGSAAVITIARPSVRFEAATGTPVVLRSSDSATGLQGETRLVLDGTWKTFAFTMKPKA